MAPTPKYAAALQGKPLIKDQSLLRAEDIRTRIRVLPELEALIPPLLPEEMGQLRANLLQHGCREALLVWETTEALLRPDSGDESTAYVLVDGHNRRRICLQEGIEFSIRLVSFASMEEVRRFMVENQLGRRNLTPEQAAYLRGTRYQQEKGSRGRAARTAAPADPSAESALPQAPGLSEPESGQGSTAERLAKRYGVSAKTIKRDAEFAAGLDKLAPDLRGQVLGGARTLTRAQVQELSQLRVPDGSLTTWEAVPHPEGPAPEPARTEDPGLLLTQLRGLVEALPHADEEWSNICRNIAACADRLRYVGRPKM